MDKENPVLALRDRIHFSRSLTAKQREDAVLKAWDAYLMYESEEPQMKIAEAPAKEPTMKRAKTKSIFGNLAEAAGKAPAETGPARGRPKGTAADSMPVTFHISRETYRRGRIALLEQRETRPLSKVVELLLDGWSAKHFKLPDV